MRKIREMDNDGKVCSAARLLDAGIEPGDLEGIGNAVGCTKKLAGAIAEKMQAQKDFLDYLEDLDRRLRA